MKYYFTLFCMFVLSQTAFSQNEPEKTEQYCIVKCNSIFSKDFKADFDFGDKYRPLSGWSVAKDSSGNVLKFKSEADVLNFLGKQGWKLVNAYPKAEETYTKFVFKKEFLKSELTDE